MATTEFLRVGEEVGAALEAGKPVVALESTIFSTLGLPPPANRKCFELCESAIRAAGAVPALTAVLDGVAVVGVETAGSAKVGVADAVSEVGVTDAGGEVGVAGAQGEVGGVGAAGELGRVLAGTHKVARRDLATACALGTEVGVTTVSASLALAEAAGISVFATGGIGGVHQGFEENGDVSEDLTALRRHRVVVVSAGVKAFLDIGRTLEFLETTGVPVVGWQTSHFAGFFLRDSGFGVPASVSSADDVVRMLRSGIALGYDGGILVANPIPAADELDEALLRSAIDVALTRSRQQGLTGAAVTPMVLSEIAAATKGASVASNLALAENNARLGAEIAVAIAG